MGHFWLEFDNNGHRQRYDFDQASVSIGREQGADFYLDHPTVSRQHALIVENFGNFQLVVLSQNGLTAVDGHAVQGTVDLRPGMTIQVGEVQVGFRAAVAGTFGEVATEQFSLDQVNTHAATAAMPVVEDNTAPSHDAYGSGMQSWQAAMNAPAAPQGFGGAPQQGFGGAPPQQGFGAPPQQGFGGAPPQQGFGGAPPQQGFGGAPAPANGFGAQAPPKGFGAGAKKGKDEEDFKIKSWEEIAAEAATGAHEAVGDGMTDFQRIQKAQAKANKKGGGTSPAAIAILLIAVVGLGALFLFNPGKKKKATAGDDQLPERCAGLKICYPEEKEPTCANKSDCEAKALTAYNVADELYQKKGANITNRYESYKQLDKAGRFMAKAGLDKPPDSMKDYDARLLQYEEELEKIASEHRIRHHQLQQRKMFWDMAKNVRAWQAYFPDSYNTWFQEAIESERRMKDTGSWPRKYDPKVKPKKH